MSIDQPRPLAPRPLALVTGASSGIGRALAQVLAEEGFDLVLTAEDGEGLAEAAEELRGLPARPEVAVVVADLLDAGGVERAWAGAQALGRPIDTVAANAGIGIGGSFADTPLKAELETIALNVTASTHLVKLAVQDMARRGEGRVLITGSIAGLVPSPLQAVYAASKAFLNELGLSIREELRDRGVVVTVLMPGITDTEFFDRAGMDGETAKRAAMDPMDVAKAGVRALLRDSDKVVPGFGNKLAAAMGRITPDAIVARGARKATEQIT